MSWNHNIWLVFFSEYLQITCSFDASSVDRLKTVVMHHQSWLVWTQFGFSGACLYDGSTSISRHTERKPHWLDESFSLHVSFIFYSFVHLFNQIFIMPHASRDQRSLCLQGACGSPHPWVMLKSCGFRKGVVSLQGPRVLQNKEARQTRSADKRTGPDSNDLMRRLFSSKNEDKDL